MKTARENHRPKLLDAASANRADWKRRLVVVLPLAALLLGPTPGAVGSCNQDAEDNPVLNTSDELNDYCIEKEQYICYRRRLREEIYKKEYDECAYDAERLCKTRYWRPDCRPTRRQADACLRALKTRETLDTDESDIEECGEDALCKAKAEGQEPSEQDAGDDEP